MHTQITRKYFGSCVLVLIFAISFIPCVFGAQAETFTIATYFPSPYGSYNVARLFPIDPAQEPAYTPGASCTNAGEMYFNGTESRFYICTAPAGSTNNTWRALGGSCTITQADPIGFQDVSVNRNGTYASVSLSGAPQGARFAMVYVYALSPPLPPAAQNCGTATVAGNDCDSDGLINFKDPGLNTTISWHMGVLVENSSVNFNSAGSPSHTHYFDHNAQSHAFAGFALVPLNNGSFQINFQTAIDRAKKVTIRIYRIGYIL